MKIAYITATEEEKELFVQYVSSYFKSRHTKVQLDSYSTPEGLLKHFAEVKYDIVFININYARANGVNIVYQLRAIKPDISIVLLGFMPTGKVEVILVTPLMFTLREFTETTCAGMLDTVLSHMSVRPELSVLLNTEKSVHRAIPVTSIVYAEAADHMVQLMLTSGEILSIRTPIRQIAETLKMYTEFLFPHRSFIINAFHIRCIMPDKLFLHGMDKEIPIARGKFNALCTAYEDYYQHYAEMRSFMQHFMKGYGGAASDP